MLYVMQLNSSDYVNLVRRSGQTWKEVSMQLTSDGVVNYHLE